MDNGERPAQKAAKEEADLSLLNIGELARRAGVSSRTIRYYEELEILPIPPRTEGGTRKYPMEYLAYLRWALTLKQLGFTLDEIRILAPISRRQQLDVEASVSATNLVEQQIADSEARIEVLQMLRQLVAGSLVADTSTINLLFRAAHSVSSAGAMDQRS